MTNIKDIKLIEQYRSGSLSVDELETFENRLLEDASFKELYNDFYEAEDLLKFKELWDVKGELDKFDYADESEGGNWSKYLYALVILAVLSGGVITYVFQNPKKENVVLEKAITINKSLAYPVIMEHADEPMVKSIVTEKYRGEKERLNESLVFSVDEELNILDKVDAIQEQVVSLGEKPLDLAKNCLGVPEVDYTIEPTCNGEANGRVIFKKILGEYSPYYIFNDNEKLENRGSFDDLKMGLYEILVLDNRACETKISLEVKSMDCAIIPKEETNQLNDFKIYLPHQSWKVPFNGLQGWLEIQDQSGGLVLGRKFEKGVSDEWDGINAQGKEVSPGIYYYKIKNENDDVEKFGTITILK